MHEMLKPSFGDNIMGRTDFWVVFSIQIWRILYEHSGCILIVKIYI